MANAVRYEPWNVVPRLQDEINRLFGNVIETENGSSGATANWIPAVDIHEYADRFEIYVDVPGIEPGSVELTLEGEILSLAGERSTSGARANSEEPEARRIERAQGRFYRRFVLPDTADSSNVKAAGRNGVLTVTIPKQAKAMPRRIEVDG